MSQITPPGISIPSGADQLPLLIDKTIQELDNIITMGEPVWQTAKEYLRRSMFAEENPYKKLSLLLTGLHLTAYASRLHYARINKEPAPWISMPPVVYQIEIKDGALPNGILPIVLGEIENFVYSGLRSILAELKRNEPTDVRYWVFETPLKALIILANKSGVEKALAVFQSILSDVQDAGANVSRFARTIWLDDGVPRELMEKGVKRLTPVSAMISKLSQEEMRRIIERYGFTIDEVEVSSGEKILRCTKKFDDVYLVFNIAWDGITSAYMEVFDIPPEIDFSYSGVDLGPVILSPLMRIPEIDVGKTVKYLRKVQRIGGKMGLYLTEPLAHLGVEPGDYVEIIYDPEKKALIIRRKEEK